MTFKYKILAVDDNSISLATIEQALKEKYEVTPLNSGVRALQYLKKNKPDLILLDVRMASKDGVETLREIREMEDCQNIPVIMLTSQNDKHTVLESFMLGADNYILKPFNVEDLHERIESVLRKAGRRDVVSLRDRDGKCDGAGIEPAPVFLFQLDAECKIARSGVEQQTVIKVLCIKDLSELFRRHQVIAL